MLFSNRGLNLSNFSQIWIFIHKIWDFSFNVFLLHPQNINRETFFCKFFRFKLIFPFQTKNMTILTKDKPAASRQKIGHHNDKNRYGSDVPDDEIHRGEDHIGSLQHPLVGELPADIGLLHLPADKYHDKQGPSRH